MTATATSLPPYSTFFESFSVDSVIAKLDDHQDGYLNAFDACCGRHVRQGRGDVLALVHEDTQGQDAARPTQRNLMVGQHHRGEEA